MTTYTTIPNPSGTSYTNVNAGSIPYDNSFAYNTGAITYDGMSNTYIQVSHLTGSLATAGQAMGNVGGVYAGGELLANNIYVNVNNPTN